MNNPIHTHTTELDIICAGQTKTHELRVTYIYYPVDPILYRGLKAQVEIQYIDEVVSTKDKGIKTETVAYLETEYSKLIWNSPEHIEAIEREILEELE